MQCFPAALLRLVLSGCVVLGVLQCVCVWLQELPPPAGGAALTAALEPERHLLVSPPLQQPPGWSCEGRGQGVVSCWWIYIWK